MGLTLRYPYEVRGEASYFEDIPELKLPREMLDLATHIVNTKSGHFDRHYSRTDTKTRLLTCSRRKRLAKRSSHHAKAAAPRVVNLMDALRASIDAEKKKALAPSTEVRRPAKRKASQK